MKQAGNGMHKREKYQHITGIIAPVVTPWTPDGQLDEGAFRAQVRHILDAGVHGISPAGSTGEGAMVHDSERNRMIQIIKEENHGCVPIVAGIIRQSTRDAIKAAKEARDAGAHALMVTPIQYLGGTDAEGNYRFYQTISDAVDLPIIIYNVVPQNEILPSLAFRLLDIENVIGIKQSLGGVCGFMAMRARCEDKGLLYAATDELMYTTFCLGADGAIAAILGLFPELCVRLWNMRDAKSREADELQELVYDIWMNIIGAQFPRRLKAALELIGRGCGKSLSPLGEASPEEYLQIQKAVDRYLAYRQSAG